MTKIVPVLALPLTTITLCLEVLDIKPDVKKIRGPTKKVVLVVEGNPPLPLSPAAPPIGISFGAGHNGEFPKIRGLVYTPDSRAFVIQEHPQDGPQIYRDRQVGWQRSGDALVPGPSAEVRDPGQAEVAAGQILPKPGRRSIQKHLLCRSPMYL